MQLSPACCKRAPAEWFLADATAAVSRTNSQPRRVAVSQYDMTGRLIIVLRRGCVAQKRSVCPRSVISGASKTPPQPPLTKCTHQPAAELQDLTERAMIT